MNIACQPVPLNNNQTRPERPNLEKNTVSSERPISQAPTPAALTTSYEQSQAMPIGEQTSPLHIQHLWWLQQTQVSQAWRYSSGYIREAQRPVRVAVIDSGYAGLWKAIQPGGDLEGQVLWQEGLKIMEQDYLPKQFESWTLQMLMDEDREIVEQLDVPPFNLLINVIKSHGTRATSTIVSRLNDGAGIVGVAPQAQVIPIKVGNGTFHNWLEVTRALEYLAQLPEQQRVDIVSMSLWDGRPIEFMRGWTPEHPGYPLYARMKKALDSLNQNNTIVLAAGGNGGWDARHNFPAGMVNAAGERLFPDLISVGALKNAESPQRAVFTPDEPHRRQHGSNWGEQIDIWAPGQDLVAVGAGQLRFYDTVQEREVLDKSGEVVPWGGSSAATPLVAGVVALLKAVQPDLHNRKGALVKLLRDSADIATVQDPLLRRDPQPTTPETLTECGTRAEPLDCGEFQSANLQLHRVNALTAIQGIAQSSDSLKSWQGELLAPAQLRDAAGNIWTLGFGADAEIKDYYAQSEDGPVPLLELFRREESRRSIEVRGWALSNEKINVLEIKLLE